MIINTVKFTAKFEVMATVLNGVVIDPINMPDQLDCGLFQVEARLS